MKVLSLFDGMSCGMIAFRELGIVPNRYVAYEIDKYAIQTSKHNFPEIEHYGDVFDADFTQYEGFDFLIGGSPCTHWSIAQTKNRETTASGVGWELFSQYVRALHEAKPKYFLYENNKSMSKAIKESISETFGFEPILINSALVSVQNRQRLYWCGIRQEDGTYRKANIEQPEDKGILLKDILETGIAWQDESFAYTTRCQGAVPENTIAKHQHTMVAEPVKYCTEKNVEHLMRDFGSKGKIVSGCDKTPTLMAAAGCGGGNGIYYGEPVRPMNYELESVMDKDSGVVAVLDMKAQDNIKRVYGENGKAPTLTTCGGGHREPKVFSNINDVTINGKNYPVYEVKDGQITIKGKQYPIKLADGYYIIRKLTVRECMRLQTVPEWFEFPVSNTQSYKQLGNGWTCSVICHLVDSILKDDKE